MIPSEYERAWDVVADKGYQGASELLRIENLKKKPPRGMCGTTDDWVYSTQYDMCTKTVLMVHRG